MDYLPLSAATIAVSGAAVIASTTVRHFTHYKENTEKVEARKGMAFDQAFTVVKRFMEKASLHTVEELQALGNVFLPAPYWVRVVRVTIPFTSRLEASTLMIKTLGEDDVRNVLGGSEWWQRDAHKKGGIDAEWISMKRDWQGLDIGSASRRATDDEDEQHDEDGWKNGKDEEMKRAARKRQKRAYARGKKAESKLEQADKADYKRSRKLQKQRNKHGLQGSGKAKGVGETNGKSPEVETPPSDSAEPGEEVEDGDDEENYSADMDEMRCMLYIHGGAYFFGSINTHRHTIWRYARKTGGRAFAINYRLAPQYPFPCALADAFASYMYLIRPPPGAKHRPVDPSKLTIAGDSAGGGLSLALLCLIRDSGLPLPAGGILISPWCDLTHSFPSILSNTDTDIIPPYGFLFKPSTLWPPPPAEFQERANRETSLRGLKKAHYEAQRLKKGQRNKFMGVTLPRVGTNGSSSEIRRRNAENKGEELAHSVEQGKDGTDSDQAPQNAENNKDGSQKNQSTAEVGKTFKIKIDGEEVELQDQIQLYATNDQLAYPYVSPLWQPSLGGLPPLYILAGEKEVLRDEIIFMAHRAANPSAYPIRKALLDANPARTRMQESYGPTKVHLQVYDDACHVLPLFSFLDQAKYTYRAIASFIVWCTELKSSTSGPGTPQARSVHKSGETEVAAITTPPQTDSPPSRESIRGDGHDSPEEVADYKSTSNRLQIPGEAGPSDSLHLKSSSGASTSSRGWKTPDSFLGPIRSNISLRSGEENSKPGLDETLYSASNVANRPPFVDNMIRERISLTGVVRPMESLKDMSMIHLDPNTIGVVKEGPVKRYLAGKVIWDKRFKHATKRVNQRREHHLQKSMKEESSRIATRMKSLAIKSLPSSKRHTPQHTPTEEKGNAGFSSTIQRMDSPEPLEQDTHQSEDSEVEGIWELHGERPPPSSIAARKDTMEARQLARVLDTHYSKIHALHLWSEATEFASAPPPRRPSI